MIRPMERRDKDPVMALVRATGFFTESEVGVAEELIDLYLDEPEQEDYRVVVVEDEKGRTAGYLTWGPTPLAEGVYDLYWMAVAPGEQGKGLGRALVRWLEKQIGEIGGRMIVIETSSQPKYKPTRAFYEGLGYKETARLPDFYKPGDDRIIYTKNFR